jgi:ribosome-associated protein
MRNHDDYDDFDQEPPSRSELKRASEALQVLGERLVELTPSQLKTVPMPDTLRDAVKLAQRISAHGGRRRQLQFIGKLMRQVDPEPIREAIAIIENRSGAAVARMHLAERWRERLIGEGDAALGEFLDEFPQVDRQQVRQLARGAQQERDSGKPPKASRQLFKLIRGQLAHDAPEADAEGDEEAE